MIWILLHYLLYSAVVVKKYTLLSRNGLRYCPLLTLHPNTLQKRLQHNSLFTRGEWTKNNGQLLSLHQRGEHLAYSIAYHDISVDQRLLVTWHIALDIARLLVALHIAHLLVIFHIGYYVLIGYISQWTLHVY